MRTDLLILVFIFWYAFNAGYNVFNNYVKLELFYPYAIASSQLVVGLFYAIPLWVLGLRTTPNLNLNDIITLTPIAILNMAGHVFAVVAMFQKGGGSFTHVIKASEPVVSVIVGLLMFGTIPKPLTAISLLPITYGVAYASTLGNLSVEVMQKELTSTAAVLAMGSNIAFCLRSALRKTLTSDFKTRTKLDAANEHAVTTIYSFLLSLPVVYVLEPIPKIIENYESIQDKTNFQLNVVICGLCWYLYNEMQNIVLSSLGPVPTAVGNTLKRVVIFVALYYFTSGETFPVPKVVGCAIAVSGCLAFAIFDSKKI